MDILGSTVDVKLSSAETDGYTLVFTIRVPPGMGIPPHVHTQEDEIVYVTEGELDVVLGEVNQKAAKGAALDL